MARVGTSGPGFTVQNDIIAPATAHFNEAQKKKYMAKIASGEIITAIAMTEPGTGSDLANVQTTAVRKGDHYVLNGAKMFITNGIMSYGGTSEIMKEIIGRSMGF